MKNIFKCVPRNFDSLTLEIKDARYLLKKKFDEKIKEKAKQ
jgi:hypothetical protein